MKTLWMLVFILSVYLPLTSAQKEQKQEKPSQVVYLVSLQGEITDGLAKEVKTRLQKVDIARAKAVLLEIDTPGGRVDMTFEICDEIDRLAREGVPVYCFVLNKALSGGALVALSCEKIFMRKTALLGDAKVIVNLPFQGIKDADEKFAAPVRKRFGSYAENRQYPKALAEAMVDPDIVVLEVEYRGMRYFKTPEELQKMRQDPDLNPADIFEKGVVKPAGKLATFTAKEARDYGFCKGIYAERPEVLKDLDLSQYPLEEINVTTTEGLVNFLTNKFVVFLLISLGILGIVIELWTPGFGIPGILGLTCLALFFAGGYLANVTAIWEIVLFIVGVALLAVEIFVLPGFGIIGISGLICCFVALLLSLQAFSIPQTEQELDIFMINLLTLTLGIGVDIASVFMLSKFLPESAPLRRLSVSTVQRAEEGYTVAIAALERLLGREGLALSPLRPAGMIEVDGSKYDAVTQGDFILKGEAIRVLEIQGNRVIVEKVRTA